jgi:hypothetical protein
MLCWYHFRQILKPTGRSFLLFHDMIIKIYGVTEFLLKKILYIEAYIYNGGRSRRELTMLHAELPMLGTEGGRLAKCLLKDMEKTEFQL